MEYRKTVRYAVEVPAIFTWVDQTGTQQRMRGSTLNVSSKGAFIVAPVCPPVGATIRLELFLDLLREALRRVWSVAQARVVRLEQSGTGRMSGFAAATMRFTLRNGVAREEA